MKTLLAFAALVLVTAAAQADSVRGYFRSNGVVILAHCLTPPDKTTGHNLS